MSGTGYGYGYFYMTNSICLFYSSKVHHFFFFPQICQIRIVGRLEESFLEDQDDYN